MMITCLEVRDTNGGSGKKYVNMLGLNSDTKPTEYSNGSKFTEINSGKVWLFNERDGAWIDTSITKYIVSIGVTTAPTKVSYYVGDAFDPTDMHIDATYSDASVVHITNDKLNIVSPEALALTDELVTMIYTENGQIVSVTQAITVEAVIVESIEVTTPPTKTDYHVTDTLDLTDVVVTATYNNGSTSDVTSSCTFTPADGSVLGVDNATITVEFVEGEVTKTTTQTITISTITLASIEISTPPAKTAYTVGDLLDLTGIVVTATYSDASTSIVSDLVTSTPPNGTVLTVVDNTVVVFYKYYGVSKTAPLSITVTP